MTILLFVLYQHTLPLFGYDEPLSNEIVLFGAGVLMVTGFGILSRTISLAGTYSFFSKFNYSLVGNGLEKQGIRAFVGIGVWALTWWLYEHKFLDLWPFSAIRNGYRLMWTWFWKGFGWNAYKSPPEADDITKMV
jgi:hypothetical protein